MMKKYFLILGLLFLSIGICMACGNEQGKEEERDTFAFQKLKEEIYTELEAAKTGKYENLNITCEEIRLPQNETIQSVKFPVYKFTKKMSLQEKLDFYKDIIFPKVYDLETVDESCVVDLQSGIKKNGKWYFEDYTYLMEHIEEIDEGNVGFGYVNDEKYQYMACVEPEGVCMNMSFGTLGTIFQNYSPFLAADWEVVKTYDCYTDDLSDSYLLMDGEKTVAEAKAEMEAWLDALYPLVGDNGIENEIYWISVEKIPDTEYHVFHAGRTLSYNGIPTRGQMDTGLPREMFVMGEAYMCESNKVDLLVGFVNCFDQGSVLKEYDEFISFEEVLSGLSYYLTDDTKFDVRYIGMEYRMFTEVVGEVTYYNWIPYWCFYVENPNDDRVMRLYMNMETGEFE